MNEEEKKEIELDIEAKYVGKTEKEFLSRVTYAECLYILTPENEYCDEIIKLSLLKICEIIDKLQKENEELRKFILEGVTIEKSPYQNYRLDFLRENFIPIKEIKEKFKKINETKIDLNKINARDYMIFGETETATGWFINIDYIEKILLGVPGYEIESKLKK